MTFAGRFGTVNWFYVPMQHSIKRTCRTQCEIYSYFLSFFLSFFLVFLFLRYFLFFLHVLSFFRIIKLLPPVFFLSFCVLVIFSRFTFWPLLLFSKYPFSFCSLFSPSAISIMVLHLHMIPILQAPFHVEHPFTNATYFFRPSRFPRYKVVLSNSN